VRLRELISEEYERIAPLLESDPEAPFALATVRLGIRHDRLVVDFWREITEDPPKRHRGGLRRDRRRRHPADPEAGA
jgi:hypothetical protein